jgi:hypothetical protein
VQDGLKSGTPAAVKQMSIMAFVKKKKEAEMATRTTGAANEEVAKVQDVINSEKTFNANKDFLADFENLVGSDKSVITEDEERKKKELIEREMMKTIKFKSKHSSDKSESSSANKSSDQDQSSPKKKDHKDKEKKKQKEKKAKPEVAKPEPPGPETEKTPKKIKKWKEDDDKDSPAKKNLALALAETDQTSKKVEAVDDSKALDEKKDDKGKGYCNVAKATQNLKEKENAPTLEASEEPLKIVEQNVAKAKEKVVAEKSEEATSTPNVTAAASSSAKKSNGSTGDADFENMGYVSGDDTTHYSEDTVKQVNAPKPPPESKGEEEQAPSAAATGTTAGAASAAEKAEVAGQSPKANNFAHSESNKSPPVVLISRNVAEIEAVDNDDTPPAVTAEKISAAAEALNNPETTASETASTKATFSPSVQDELNALKSVGGQESNKAMSSAANDDLSRINSDSNNLGNVSSCMMEQQSMNMGLNSYNPQQDHQAKTGMNDDQQQQQQQSSVMYDTAKQQQTHQQHQGELGPSMGVYTPDSATNSVHSLHGGYANAGEMTEGSVPNIMESPNSISSVDMNTNANNASHSNNSIDASGGTPQSHMQHTTPQHQTQYDHMAGQQTHIHQTQMQSPHMPTAQQSPHHPPSLPSQSPHSQHNMTSPHPQPSPHGAASNHSQQTSPHPMTIPPAANSPYAAVPQPSPGSTPGLPPAGTGPPQQQQAVAGKAQAQQQTSRTPTRSPQQNPQSVASHHLHNMHRFYPNYYPNPGNYQGIPPHMFPPGPGMFPSHLPGASPTQKRGGEQASNQAQAGYYGNHGNAQQNTAAAARHHAGSLAKLQQLTNGLDIPGMQAGPGPVPSHPLQPPAANPSGRGGSGSSSSGGNSSKQGTPTISPRNAALLPSAPAYHPYHQGHNRSMMPHGRQASAAAANIMQYSHNQHMLNSYAAQYNFMQMQHPYPSLGHVYQQAAADHQRNSAGTPHRQGTNPHPHVYPTGYPAGYLNYP